MFMASPSANAVAKPYVANRGQEKRSRHHQKNYVSHPSTPSELATPILLRARPAYSNRLALRFV